MEHIQEKLNSDYKFRTLTADDGYIIANVLHGFDADNYIGTKTMVLPAEREVSGLVAITEQQHRYESKQKRLNCYLVCCRHACMGVILILCGSIFDIVTYTKSRLGEIEL